MRTYAIVNTLIGPLYLVADNGKLAAVHIGEEDFLANENKDEMKEAPCSQPLHEAIRQMEEYFSGARMKFELPLACLGTDFQLDVWKQLSEIPFGMTRSYQEVAEAIGRPKAVRAVGQANKANKLPIVIPCHRVIGKNQSLTGYAGTRTDIKDQLLRLEGATFKPPVQPAGSLK
ncbi:cysteine methyltransferase [Mesobacillus campisalis]|uniref:Methylated-DNA--protein-cysteine methyltransferase n=1 Tax=Mesobacillus campisalis TaxID=1408103 RepID=A0A0M2SI81_9BACI|nr:methylated-DNA--[protein]-cysteine S-methyltransferase [Mesobacillus campisalis]KKK34399.1 cysteine methyltransferase [Mesobacillus campisalis]